MKSFKKKGILVLIIFCTVVFGGGLIKNYEWLSKLRYPSREIKVGKVNPDYKERVDFSKVITDYSNQHEVDNLEMILYNAEVVNNITVNSEKPDLIIMINSPRESVSLKNLELYFINDETIIVEGSDEYGFKYKKINSTDSKYLKKIIDFM